ncbi:hypothetical protein QYM36_018645, partial [Artemia franciscana]
MFPSRAIKLDGQNAVYFCNRAAAHSKAENYKAAVDDCKKAIEIDPKYAKAYGRMGLAYSALKQYKESLEAYQMAVQLEPGNESYRVNVKISEDNLKQSTPEMPSLAARADAALGGSAILGIVADAILLGVARAGSDIVGNFTGMSDAVIAGIVSDTMASPSVQSYIDDVVEDMSS